MQAFRWTPERAVGVLGVVLLLAPPARAELLGEWGGGRRRLEEHGVVVQLFFNQLLSAKPAGGGARDDASLGHNASYDLLARLDLGLLAGWGGADVLLHLKGQYDRSVNADVGALSDPIDDADFDEPLYLDQLWLQQALLDGRLRLRVGFLEQQTLFDRNAYANSEDRQFLATFLDNGLLPLPNGLAAALIVTPLPGLEIAIGAADADNTPRDAGFDTALDGIDSLTGYLEIAFHHAAGGRGLPGNLRLGGFLDGRERRDFRSSRSGRGHLGAYASIDQLAWRERPESAQGLGLFARGGAADPDVNRVSGFWSVGLQYTGLLPGREADELGIAAYQTIGSDAYRDAVDPSFDRETGIELYYRIAAATWLDVTPDLQYIRDPGATGDADDAIVATLRLRVAF